MESNDLTSQQERERERKEAALVRDGLKSGQKYFHLKGERRRRKHKYTRSMTTGV